MSERIKRELLLAHWQLLPPEDGASGPRLILWAIRHEGYRLAMLHLGRLLLLESRR